MRKNLILQPLVVARKPSTALLTKIFFAIFCTAICLMANTAYAEIAACQVGNTSDYVSPEGYWQMVGTTYQGKCIIPGPPHPDSAFLHGNTNGAFRIEGRYRVDTVLTGWGFSWTPGECPSNSCISGFREWMCYDVYGTGNYGPYASFYMEDNNCVYNYDDGSTNIKNYACFTDTAHITLLEWKCKPQTPEPIEPNKNQGSPACEL
jgi:hypothetical protein